MKDSESNTGERGSQITLWGQLHKGSPCEDRLEADNNKEACKPPTASTREKNGETAKQQDLLEAILEPENLTAAYEQVKRNRGSHGVDGMRVNDLLEYLTTHDQELREALRSGNYIPSCVRRVEIPKPDGGKRQLGIPTVIDRMIQQAMAQVLSPIFEATFTNSSYGFRPGKNGHQAIRKAQRYMNAGNTWVVDIDLEKYFDTVNHDKLMALVARQVKDKRVLKLIRAYLNAGVMINGVVIETHQGCQQGGPLSPLLSNVMLNQLDHELERRGHRYCRYADDSQIYVKSEKAAKRVMASITHYLEDKLKLKVNQRKSAIGRCWERKYLGFSFYRKKGRIRIRVHPKSLNKVKEKVRVITARRNGWSMEHRLNKLRQLITGWVSYYQIADMKSHVKRLDQWTRRRIRMCFWRQWKNIKTRFKNLVKLGANRRKALRWAGTRKKCWRVANTMILEITLRNAVLNDMGYCGFTEVYTQLRES